MSECVVRMEMPTSCKKCKNTICLWVKDDDLDYMDVIGKVQDFRKKNNDVGFPDFCPILCVLPENHGRLIDAVALLNHIVHNYCDDCDDYNGLRCRACPHDDDVQCIEDAPTIVPAEAERIANEYKQKKQTNWIGEEMVEQQIDKDVSRFADGEWWKE